jgi:hypothetical protein
LYFVCWDATILKHICKDANVSDHSGNHQGTAGENSGNAGGKFGGISGNAREPLGGHSGNPSGTFGGHSGNPRGTYRERGSESDDSDEYCDAASPSAFEDGCDDDGHNTIAASGNYYDVGDDYDAATAAASAAADYESGDESWVTHHKECDNDEPANHEEGDAEPMHYEEKTTFVSAPPAESNECEGSGIRTGGSWFVQAQVLYKTIIIITIINMLMPVQQIIFTHLKVLTVITDRSILAQSNPI